MRICFRVMMLLTTVIAVGSAKAQPAVPDSETLPPDTLADSLAQAPPGLPDSSEEPPAEPDSAAVSFPVDPDDPISVILAYFEALRSGDAVLVVEYTSSEAVDGVSVMLEGLKESLDRDAAGTLARMSASGYTATADEIGDWNPADYLAAAVSLSMMKNRYLAYSMQTGDAETDGDETGVSLVFTTQAGATIPFQARMIREDDAWKVSTFLGLNSFP
jgi:hypothetical protein